MVISFFPKNGFKIQPPIFLILNPIFERGVFWKNELTKSSLGICQGILHSISSILTYYGPQTGHEILGILHLISNIFDILWIGHSEKLYPFEVKKKIHKKSFHRYDDGTCHTNNILPFTMSPPDTVTCSNHQFHWRVPLKKTDSLQKVLKQPPKINF